MLSRGQRLSARADKSVSPRRLRQNTLGTRMMLAHESAMCMSAGCSVHARGATVRLVFPKIFQKGWYAMAVSFGGLACCLPVQRQPQKAHVCMYIQCIIEPPKRMAL